MARLTPPFEEEDDYYRSDITRMVRVCREAGYTLSRSAARRIWDQHSARFAAGWLILPERDEDLLQELIDNAVVSEDDE
jgi:hypothetical protein